MCDTVAERFAVADANAHANTVTDEDADANTDRVAESVPDLLTHSTWSVDCEGKLSVHNVWNGGCDEWYIRLRLWR